MATQHSLSADRLTLLRERSRLGREQDDADKPHVVAEHKAMLAEWQRVVASHTREIDEYIATHGPLTRAEVIDRALTKLLSDV